MKDLTGMAIFARVAEAKSFSVAARRLNLSKSVVSKHVAKLEKSLGARLLNRTTRRLSLTEIGAVFYEHCARIVEEAEEAELAVGHFGSAPRGTIKVNASVEFGTVHVAPALPVFLAKYPEVSIDMTLSDRFVDMAEEGYDVAIRSAWRDEPGLNLVARELAPSGRKVCAAPDYFKRHGVPQAPSDLVHHNCLIYTSSGGKGEWWRFVGPEGEISVPVTGNLRINDNEALWRAVLGGGGIALLPTFLIGEDLQRGALQAALIDYTPLERSVYAVYLPNRHLSPKVRTFIDFLVARFGPQPYWDRIEQ
ncbi:MAG TPA: LysR family transcriptional regulator [Burkholderiales bacterium]|nr:LysR family transcriptional regulator [Burkholderiales bacterium]